MTTKNYSERVREIKNEVLNEIVKTMNGKTSHDFKDTFFVHYVEGEVATTEVCFCVEIDSEGALGFYTARENEKFEKTYENCVEHETLFMYDTNSLIDILERLKNEIREEKLQTLRDLVKNVGGTISFDGKFKFDSYSCRRLADGSKDDKVYGGTELLELSIEDDGHLNITNYWEGKYDDPEDVIPFYELDNIIEYVLDQTKKTPEERLALTGEQKELVKHLMETYDKLRKADVWIVHEAENCRLSFFNGKDIFDYDISYKKCLYDATKLTEESYPDMVDARFYKDSERLYISFK